MKINKLMLGLLAGAMFVSCSDDLSNEPAGASDPNAIGSQGYIGVTIGMPSEPITRGLNDQFDDGKENEYAVKTAAILFFTGEESNPAFYKAYRVRNGEWNSVNDNPPQITQNKIVTFPVDFAKESTGDLWALAVINYGGIMTIDNEDNTVTIGDSKFTGNFQDFMKLTTDQAMIGDAYGFFMTNAPHSSQPGTTQSASIKPLNPEFHVLAKVDKAKIFETEQIATQHPAAAIFVERAVAKVEVNGAELKISEGAINFPAGSFNISNIQWVLDNVEPTSYIVRNLDEQHDNTKAPYWALYDTNTEMTEWSGLHYRFLGASSFGHTVWPNTPDPNEHYRTYFCVDPNGTGIEEGNLKAVTTGFTPTGSDYPQYCKENTFDVLHMDYRNTTRAVIKVRFGNGNTNLYTIGEDKKTIYTANDAASFLTWDVLNNPDAIAAWTKYFEEGNEAYSANANTENMKYTEDTNNLTADNDWMTVTMRKNTTKGRLEISKIVLKDGAGNNVAFDDANTITTVNTNIVVKLYSRGEAYYAVRIRHFGNDLTPWYTAEETTNSTLDSYAHNGGAGNDGDGTKISPQDEQNYLGRYGVVRNNWYVVTLGEILQMGEPVQGDLPLDKTPDDRVLKEESISCRINILSWAKRNQTDDL
ncbi:MAG: fimbria major subunit [Bacteroides sp.]|nr:fimbria major subunit [Bacteroides sp.]